jgi:disulfide bond formation protein DsbB
MNPQPQAGAGGAGPVIAIIGGVVLLVVVAVALGIWLVRGSSSTPRAVVTQSDPARASHGQSLFMQSCATCHGPTAQGMPHRGVDLRDSQFVRQESDAALIQFLRSGRSVNDPRNTTGLMMPPRGGNVALSDQDLADIVAHLRQVQQSAGVSARKAPTSAPSAATVSISQALQPK